MNAQQVLNLLGQVDGAVAAGALAVAHIFHSPTVTADALAVAGIAGGIGFVLTGIAKLLGLKPPDVPTPSEEG